MKKILFLFIFIAVTLNLRSQPYMIPYDITLHPDSGQPWWIVRSNTPALFNWEAWQTINTNFDFVQREISSISVTNSPIAAASTNGLIQTNIFNKIQLRNYSHVEDKVPTLGFQTYMIAGAAPTEVIVSNFITKAIAAGGPALGYKWINIDDGWTAGSRDGSGNLVWLSSAFPSGDGIIKMIHTNGFKLQLYFSMGTVTAGGHLGSKDHWYQDVTNWLAKGVDGFRIAFDDSGFNPLDYDEGQSSPNYNFINQFLYPFQGVSHPYQINLITFGYRSWMQDMCNQLMYGNTNPTYSHLVGGVERGFFDVDGTQTNDLNGLDFYAPKGAFIKPGHYFDFGCQTIPGSYAQFQTPLDIHSNQRNCGLHAIMKWPIWIGYGLDMDAPYKYVYTNKYILKIHQDPLVTPCRIISSNANIEVLSGPLAPEGGNVRVLAILNRTFPGASPSTNNVSIGWTNLWPTLPSGDYKITDVWGQSSFVDSTNSLFVSTTNDDLKIYIIEPYTTSIAPYVFNMRSVDWSQGGIYSTNFIHDAVVGNLGYGLSVPTNNTLTFYGATFRFNLPEISSIPGPILGTNLVYTLTLFSTNYATKYNWDITSIIYDDTGVASQPIVTVTGTNNSGGIFQITATNSFSGTPHYGIAVFYSIAPEIRIGAATNVLYLIGASVKKQ